MMTFEIPFNLMKLVFSFLNMVFTVTVIFVKNHQFGTLFSKLYGLIFNNFI